MRHFRGRARRNAMCRKGTASVAVSSHRRKSDRVDRHRLVLEILMRSLPSVAAALLASAIASPSLAGARERPSAVVAVLDFRAAPGTADYASLAAGLRRACMVWLV